MQIRNIDVKTTPEAVEAMLDVALLASIMKHTCHTPAIHGCVRCLADKALQASLH